MLRVALWSNDPVGERMAGPGIRYHRLATELARRHAVTLLAPAGAGVQGAGYTFRPAGPGGSPTDLDVDVVLAQSLPLGLARSLRSRGVRLVYDLYVPALVEASAQLAGETAPEHIGRLRYQELLRVTRAALLLGDAFICASERQRDLWLGALAALGRLTPAAYAADPTLRSLVEVVPFGLDVPEPTPARGIVARTFPGVAPTDRVLLWGGGVWNWLDPLTVIRAVGLVAGRRSDVKLVFLGLRHPSSAVDRMRMADRATALADELGLTGRSVFFNRAWVPYDERTSWFEDASIGVSAHVASAEARYSFRTRLLDHIAACTPLVVTEGDVFGDLVRERRLGVAVPAGDVAAWEEAIGRLLEDDETVAAARAGLAELRDELRWERVAEPLAHVLEAVVAAPHVGRSARLETTSARAAQIRSSLARRGVAGTIRALLRAGDAPHAREQ